MDVSKRAAAGKAARSQAPRSAHAEWEPVPDRPDPVEILESQAGSRVPELVPVRYGRMTASPLAFYRCAAAVMAADLAGTPTSGLRAQICGDAHLSNFGAVAAPDRGLVFDLNDFDETLPGPWEWDVKRLAASFEIAARESGFKRKRRRALVLTAAREYREAMRAFAGSSNLGVWYARLDKTALRKLRAERDVAVERAGNGVAGGRSKDSLRALGRLAHEVDGELRIVSDPPRLVPIEELLPENGSRDLESDLREILAAYRVSLPDDCRHLLDGYRFRHLAHKVVEVGSPGAGAWVALFTGTGDREDPLFLQAKEAQASVLEPYVGKSPFENQGRRVVEGQRLMQAGSDIFLGWCPAIGIDGRKRHFYLRRLWDWKRLADVESMRPKEMEAYARMCGWTLARAHARSGDRVAIAAYLGGGEAFDKALAEFSALYADQNERDHAALLEAIASGRLEAGDA